jgi:hypothetical protein
MRHKEFGVACTVSAALVLAGLVGVGLVLAGTAWGNGREFSSSYRVSDVSVSGDTATLTMTLQLFNHSTADVSNATLVLRDGIIPSRNYGTISNVNVPAGHAVQLSATFQVPQREYQSWQQGRQPFLMIEYADAAGNKVRRPIEIAPGHVRPNMRPEARPDGR